MSVDAWLIAYDVADPRRLQRVHRCVARRALGLQYSLYLLHATPPQLASLLERLERLIDRRADDIRVYPLPSRPWFRQYGQPSFPDGVTLVGTHPLGSIIAAG